VRALAAFFAALAAVLGAVALVNWRTDLEGEFYSGDAVAAASRQSCLVSDELVGTISHLPFKLDLLQLRPHTRAILGSSRVLRVQSKPGEDDFVNLGFPGMTPEAIEELARSLPDGPLTLYIGTEVFWFNPSFPVRQFRPSLPSRVRYLLSLGTLRASASLLREEPSLAVDRWRTLQVGAACVLGRTTPTLTWRLDGARVYSFELVPGSPVPPPLPYTTDLDQLRAGLYRDWRGRFDRDRLASLDRVLSLAKRKGWKVVGFAPPDGDRYVRLFNASPASREPWRVFWDDVPATFRRHGFPFLDLHEMDLIPCPNEGFVDDGYHVDAACAARIRARLDTAAG
jgi:hypothetical protein